MNYKGIVLLLLMGSWFSGTAYSQTYFVSTRVSGYVQLAVEDAAGATSACGGGTAGFGVLSDTVCLDLAANTIREIGSVTFAGGANITFEDGRIVAGSNGLQLVDANVTVNLSVPSALTFDTGVQPLLWVPAIQSYEFTATLGSVPITGSYSVVTGGQTYSGPLNYNLYTGMLLLFQQVATSSYPAFITLSGLRGGELQHPGPQLVYFTALDGLNIQLQAGEQDGTYSYGWNLGAIEAEMIPEPGSLALLSLGMCALSMVHRRRRQADTRSMPRP
ncbi:MAG: PEP-CTERM sorting domain-containing protein [Verrucomicrobiia bacterium]